MPSADENVVSGSTRSAGAGACTEYADRFVIVVRVGGHPPAGRSAGHPVAPDRYVDEPAAMNVRFVGVQRADG